MTKKVLIEELWKPVAGEIMFPVKWADVKFEKFIFLVREMKQFTTPAKIWPKNSRIGTMILCDPGIVQNKKVTFEIPNKYADLIPIVIHCLTRKKLLPYKAKSRWPEVIRYLCLNEHLFYLKGENNKDTNLLDWHPWLKKLPRLIPLKRTNDYSDFLNPPQVKKFHKLIRKLSKITKRIHQTEEISLLNEITNKYCVFMGDPYGKQKYNVKFYVYIRDTETFNALLKKIHFAIFTDFAHFPDGRIELKFRYMAKYSIFINIRVGTPEECILKHHVSEQVCYCMETRRWYISEILLKILGASAQVPEYSYFKNLKGEYADTSRLETFSESPVKFHAKSCISDFKIKATKFAKSRFVVYNFNRKAYELHKVLLNNDNPSKILPLVFVLSSGRIKSLHKDEGAIIINFGCSFIKYADEIMKDFPNLYKECMRIFRDKYGEGVKNIMTNLRRFHNIELRKSGDYLKIVSGNLILN